LDPEHVEFQDEMRQYEGEPKPSKPLNAKALLEPLRSLRLRRAEPLLARPEETVGEAAVRMSQARFGCILVVEGGRLVGICTERDIMDRVLVAGKDPGKVRLEEIMTREPECLEPEDSVAFALHLMHIGGYRHVPLVDEQGRPVGIVSVQDIVDHIVDHFPEEVYNLPPRPQRRGPSAREGA
jgi:CBS domain-containing protein